MSRVEVFQRDGSMVVASSAPDRMPEHFDSWMTRALSAEIPDAGPRTRLTLSHCWANGRSRVLSHWPLGDEELDTHALASEIWTSARDHATAFPGRGQTYEVVVYYGDEYRPYARTSIRVTAPAEQVDGSLDGYEMDEGTSRGLLTQLMRHNEVMQRAFIGSFGEILAHDRRMLADKEQRIAELEMQQVRALELAEKATDRQHERELDLRKAATADKRVQALIENLKVLAPVLANRIAGTQVLPDTVSGTDGVVRALIQSLKPEQFAALLSQLEPAQQMAVLELAKKFVLPAPPKATEGVP